MRKLFMVIFGLLLVVVCYHSPPDQVQNLYDINYDLPGENVLPVPVITIEERGITSVIIKGPLQEVRSFYVFTDVLQTHLNQLYSFAIVESIRKIGVRNLVHYNEKRISDRMLLMKGLSILPSNRFEV